MQNAGAEVSAGGGTSRGGAEPAEASASARGAEGSGVRDEGGNVSDHHSAGEATHCEFYAKEDSGIKARA
jgi:hypothetical protein